MAERWPAPPGRMVFSLVFHADRIMARARANRG
jgi:hypothetical protein